MSKSSARILDLSPFLTQTVKTQNPLNGELSHGSVTQAVHQGVQAGRRTAAGIGGSGPRRTPRVHRSMAEKRQIVEQSLQPGMSVARAAQAAGVNANQVFKWRQDYRSGLLLEA